MHGLHLEVIRLDFVASRRQRYSARVRARLPVAGCEVSKTPHSQHTYVRRQHSVSRRGAS